MRIKVANVVVYYIETMSISVRTKIGRSCLTGQTGVIKGHKIQIENWIDIIE
jgi:hypothetical protein